MDDHFGERVAATYDESYAELFEPDVVGPMVEQLVRLADGGRALELGIGTGRPGWITTSLSVADARDAVTVLQARPPVRFCTHQLG